MNPTNAPDNRIISEPLQSGSLEVKGTEATGWRSRKSLRTLALYLTMVSVSTLAIYLLEHASLIHAVRTALVAAVAKTYAATWVNGFFE